MPAGDDAAAAGMDLVPGSTQADEIDTEINKTRDYIAQRTSAITPIAKGGTGADTVSGARTNLGAAAASHTHPATAISTSGGASNVQADQDYIVGQLNTHWIEIGRRIENTGGNISGNLGVAGHIFVPGSTPASSGWTIAYINSDGRISRGASSARYKDDIVELDPLSLGDLFPPFASYVMKDDPGKMTRYGYIAETLDESDALRPFVVYQREPIYEQLEVRDCDGNVTGYQQGRVIGSTRVRDKDDNPVPESIDFIALLLAQVAQLHEHVEQLTARVATLEGS